MKTWSIKLMSRHLSICTNETHFFTQLSYHFPKQWPQTYIPLPALMLHTSRRDALLLMWDWVNYLPQLTTEEPAELKGLCTLSPMQTGSTLLANNPKLCWILRVAPVCTPCCMLLGVVGSCCAKFETDQTFRYVQKGRNNSQQCCVRLHGALWSTVIQCFKPVLEITSIMSITSQLFLHPISLNCNCKPEAMI